MLRIYLLQRWFNQRQDEVILALAPQARHFTHRCYRHHGQINDIEKAKFRTKSRVYFLGGSCL